MNKTLQNLVFFTLFIIVISSCRHKETASYTQMGWSSANPLSIPLKNRIQKQQMGNLVPNHSFEKGRFFSFDSTDLTFNLNVWKKVGQNVEWVNLRVDSVYSKEDVSQGLHAIKITNTHANETDKQGNGVMSDFIKVIPGNYDFSLDIKLENIRSNTERLGTKIYDAIDIRIDYYDKNKILMPGETFSPSLNKKIDISFKGASFSHFWEINKFGWSRINGHSYFYPFNEGDIPDDAKYVKIFVGLKGTGTMWVDNIEFRYSNKNFTTLEQTICYFDSVYTPDKFLTPTPQFIFPKDAIFFKTQEQKKILILIPENNSKLVDNLSRKLKSTLDKALVQHQLPEAEITTSITKEDLAKGNIIFSLGNTGLLADYMNEIPADKLKNKEQGYLIKCISGKADLVFLYALGDAGLKYGMNTLAQLISIKGSYYYDATIIDFPSYENRSLVLNDINENILTTTHRYFEKHNLNSYYITPRHAEIRNTLKNHYNQVGFIINNKNINSFPNSLSTKIIFSSAPDIFVRKDTFLTEENWYRKSKEDLEKLHQLSKKHGQIILKPFSDGINGIIKGKYASRLYFEHINRLAETPFTYSWMGKSAMCNSFDMAEVELFKTYSGQYPVFYDQHFLATNMPKPNVEIFKYFPFKLRLSSLIEPFKTNIPVAYSNLSPGKEIIAATNLTSYIQQFSVATYADYAWNPAAYNPYFSLVKILIHELGREGTKSFLHFNDAYVGMTEICIAMEKNMLKIKPNKLAEQYIVELNINYRSCNENFTENTELLTELRILKEELIEKYHKLYEQQLIKQKLETDSSVLFSQYEE